jgi:hypothetical protein
LSLNDFSLDGGDGIYKLTWPELHVDIMVDRIKADTDHQVKAEINATSSRPNSPGHLRGGRLILTSPSSKKSMVKSLEERESEVDWDTIIEQLCTSVLHHYRSGSPAVEITGDADVKASNRWLIEPLLQLGHPTLIYGQGSAGKSWFAQYMSVLADCGMSASKLLVEPARVLYLDWETTQAEIGVRVAMLRKGLGLQSQSHIWYREMMAGLYNDVEAIRHLVMEKNIELIILDSLGSACMGEPESAEIVLRMFQSLRSLRCTSLCIDHTNKEGHLFGSVYKFNSGRQIFEIKKAQTEGEDSLEFALFHRKANNSKLVKPMGWQLRFADDSVTLTRKDVKDTGLESELRIADRIQNLLQRGAMAPKDLAEELEREPSHIRKELSEWTAKGRFIRLSDGRYAVRAREDEWSAPI